MHLCRWVLVSSSNRTILDLRHGWPTTGMFMAARPMLASEGRRWEAGVAPESKEHDVFISFATQDRALADIVSERLRRDGIHVWRYTDTPRSGTWHLNELRALRDSKVAIFVITPHSAASASCLDEAQRAANPTQLGSVPVPLVAGAWDYRSSDLWLLLSKWNGIVASPDLNDDALHRLTKIVHDRLGFRPVSSLSTGQALVAVKDDVCAYLEEHHEVSSDEILRKTRELQVQHRGNMVGFEQFTYLDREIMVSELISTPEKQIKYLTAYLRAFFDQIAANAYTATATRLASHIALDDTIVVSEYSRVLLQAFKVISETDHRLMQSLRVIIINRTGMLLVDDEPARMADELMAMGASVDRVIFSDWVDYLLTGADRANLGTVNKILFGVESFSMNGDVIFPQIVKELDALHNRKLTVGGAQNSEIIAAGESYKVCRDSREVSKMISDPHYTVMPNSLFDLLVTDIAEFRSTDSIRMSACIQHVEAAADNIRATLWPNNEPLPIWNAPWRKLAGIKVIAADVDGTVTTEGRISAKTLTSFDTLKNNDCRVVLVTGRSAGWGAALASYLPGLAGVVAENGAVFIQATAGEVAPTILDPSLLDESGPSIAAVEECLSAVLSKYPTAHAGSDNYCRITDRTIEVGENIDPQVVRGIAQQYGLNHTFSTVHHHLSRSSLTKKTGLLLALREYVYPEIDVPIEVATIGDSVNDTPLFEADSFAITFGVRGILRWLSDLGNRVPKYVTLADGGVGFNEICGLIVRAREVDRRIRKPGGRLDH
jgi:hydroxymethylpyrimidine pyrophosphatase-like HAD family hydrolase